MILVPCRLSARARSCRCSCSSLNRPITSVVWMLLPPPLQHLDEPVDPRPGVRPAESFRVRLIAFDDQDGQIVSLRDELDQLVLADGHGPTAPVREHDEPVHLVLPDGPVEVLEPLRDRLV